MSESKILPNLDMAAQTLKIIHSPNQLSKKVQKEGGPDLEDFVANSEKVFLEHTEGFNQIAVSRLLVLNQALVLAKESNNIAKQRNAIFFAAHEIRGLSGSFGYPLATMAADFLSKFIMQRKKFIATDLPYIDQYIITISAIFRNCLTNAGGKKGKELKKLLIKMDRSYWEKQSELVPD